MVLATQDGSTKIVHNPKSARRSPEKHHASRAAVREVHGEVVGDSDSVADDVHDDYANDEFEEDVPEELDALESVSPRDRTSQPLSSLSSRASAVPGGSHGVGQDDSETSSFVQELLSSSGYGAMRRAMLLVVLVCARGMHVTRR